MFNKLEFKSPNIFIINNRKDFIPEGNLNGYIDRVFDFAFNMTFAKSGYHRDHRSGGINQRKYAEQFINVFQGKLAEFAVYKKIINSGILINEPDLRVMGLGSWDDSDFICTGKKISVKSAAYFSNLLLLEKKDWDTKGCYLPNSDEKNDVYDYFILVRIKPDGKQFLLDYKETLLREAIDKIELKRLMINGKSWIFDIPGFFTHQDLLFVIDNGFTLPQKALLNGKIEMDADNYYVQSGDLKPFEELMNVLKNSSN